MSRSIEVRRLLQGYGVRCPVVVVPTGIDLRRFQQTDDPMRRAVLRASLGIPAENTVLVCVGRLAEEKNIQELLKLRASLASRPVTLLLVGDGPDRAPSYKIGELAMEKLREIDEVAYVRFASVYRQFKDIDSFMKELQAILEARTGTQKDKNAD